MVSFKNNENLVIVMNKKDKEFLFMIIGYFAGVLLSGAILTNYPTATFWFKTIFSLVLAFGLAFVGGRIAKNF